MKYPSVVDQDVELAEKLDCELDRTFDGFCFKIIGLDRQRPAPHRLNITHHLFRAACGSRIGDRHVGTVRRQSACDRRADAAAAARHECNLPSQFGHGALHFCSDR
jgi:hypothetical protein